MPITFHLIRSTQFPSFLKTKMQKTIHISFKNDDTDLYNELMRESALSYVPVSVLARNYIRSGRDQWKINHRNQYFSAE
jgi:hypothetical protein